MFLFDEICRVWYGIFVVVIICLGVNYFVFNEWVFDYCIVDEVF